MSLVDGKLIGKKGSSPLLGIVIVVALIFIVVKIYKATKSAANATGQALGNGVIAAQLGMHVDRVIYIRSEATALWEKGVKTYLWTVRDYDEEMFIKSINGMVTAKEVALLDQLYQEASGERLKDAINSSFSASDKAKLNQQWLAVLTS